MEKLDFGFCFQPFRYTDRVCRFVIDYSKITIPLNFDGLSRYKKFHNNPSKKWLSFELPSNGVLRCQFATKLITDSYEAQSFFDELLSDNPSIVSKNLNYFVIDEEGLDYPLIPSQNDIKKQLPDLTPLYIGIGLLSSIYLISKFSKK